MSNLFKILIGLVLVLSVFAGRALAQETAGETTTAEVTEAINLDENIQAEDLGVGEPRILPNNPLYFLKNWARGIQNLFTFNSVSKTELRLKFANEKLIEAKKIAEKTNDPEVIKKAVENYQQEAEKIKEQAEKIKETAKENPEVDKFLNKYTAQQLLHQRLLGKLENQVPQEVFEKIKEARERHLERFGEVMAKLEDREEKIEEKLEKNLEEVKGSKYKNFKNLEILMELAEKVPEAAREAIRKAQENALKRLQGDLEKMSPEDQERFKEYIDKISGEKERQLEILENLKSEIKALPETPGLLQLKAKLEEGKEGIMERIKLKMEGINCPEIERPVAGFCQEGRIVVKKDEKGCIISFECVIPAEVETPSIEEPAACITLWDPVCGKDGKTYSNTCFAGLAGVEIAYRGKCKEKECQTDADCPQLKCGIGIKCIGVKAKCVEGKCQVVSTEKF